VSIFGGRQLETLKPLDKVLQADERWSSFVSYKPARKGFFSSELWERHEVIASINLHELVPDSIRDHFETAKNLLLYAWFVYRFSPVGELHAYSSVEMALKEKAKSEKVSKRKSKSLSILMREAISRKWIADEGFEIYRRNRDRRLEQRQDLISMGAVLNDSPEDLAAQAYCNTLAESLLFLRNELAHGSSMIGPGGIGTLAICADLINQLFVAKPASESLSE
jgi:hypothetical protein